MELALHLTLVSRFKTITSPNSKNKSNRDNYHVALDVFNDS